MPVYETGSGTVELSVRSKGPERYVVEHPDGASEEVTATVIGGNRVVVSLPGRTLVAHVARNERGFEVFIRGKVLELRRPSTERAGGPPPLPSVTTPMPGVVVKVLVSEGQEVEVGQPAVVVEAMKMIHEICCGESGVVKKINFQEGDQVDAGVPIVDIQGEGG
jgi:3-methylcrotonyl-CoA carboxylase alpha subunit